MHERRDDAVRMPSMDTGRRDHPTGYVPFNASEAGVQRLWQLFCMRRLTRRVDLIQGRSSEREDQ